NQILDIAFFLEHVLTNNRNELFDFDFILRSTIVLHGGEQMACTSARHQTQQYTHDKHPKNFPSLPRSANKKTMQHMTIIRKP
ncbi:hypothetical protein, partial [Pseudomonas syringae group genomosp. 7]